MNLGVDSIFKVPWKSLDSNLEHGPRLKEIDI